MGKKIEKRGNNVHELSPSDFLGAWIGSCLEKGSGPASGRCSPWLVTAWEKGFNGNRNQPNSLSTMEDGKG
jgi:hypothetical protein